MSAISQRKNWRSNGNSIFTYNRWIETNRYGNGNLHVQLMTPEEPYATLSTNVDGIVLDKDCFIAKTYNENEGLCEQFIETGLFEDTGEKVSAGFVSCPILRFNG